MPSSPSGADPLGPGPRGFAHRGLHGPGVIENSLAAFRAAVADGAGIECDVRLAADGGVMIFHDEDLSRLCGEPHAFAQLPSATLSRKALGQSDQRIPRLAELLALAAGQVPLLIELKTHRGNAARLAAAVARAVGARPATGIMSFDPAVGAWLARHRPHLRRGLVLSGRDAVPVRWWKQMLARPQFLAVNVSQVEQPWFARARRRMPVYVWTVRTPDQARSVSRLADAAIWEADGRP